MRFWLPILLLFMFCITNVTQAQLNIQSAKNSGNWADYYVNNILLGAGVTAFNITFSGCDTINTHPVGTDSNQIGEFTSAISTVDIPYGVILSSGSVEQATPASVNPPSGPNGFDNASDPDLNAIASPFSGHNKAVLEFDFVPQGDSVKFKYVFGSQEYPTFVCSSFNDAFGFFLSGPGISGTYSNNAVNLAVLPGSAIPVAINTINDTAGPSNGCTPNCPCNAQYFVNNYTPPIDTNNNISGLTVNLTAKYQVNCGDTYHIKLAISDIGDGALDSYVFLEGGSFSSDVVEVNITSVNGDSTINEGCGTAVIQFYRTDTVDTSYTPIILTGTATNGVDFTYIPDTIILYPGQTDTSIVIDPFNDGINEGMEFITITAVSINPCGDTFYSSGTLYFFDVPNLNISLTDTILKCPEVDSIALFANVLSGGPPPYTINWSTGQTGSTINYFPIQTNGFDTLIVSVQDSCALYLLTDTLIYRRDVAPFPIVSGIPDTIVDCTGDTVKLSYSGMFGSGQSIYYWHTNDTLPNIDVIVNGGEIFTITMVDSCLRMAVDTLDIQVAPFIPLVASLNDTIVYCPGDLVALNPSFNGGVPDFEFSWDAGLLPVFDDSLQRSFAVNNDTVAYFSFRDACGRIATDSANLLVSKTDPLTLSIIDQEVACSGVEVTLPPIVEGGSIPYSYKWSTGDTNRVLTFTVNVDQDINLTVTDYCGREVAANAVINTPEFPNLELIIAEDGAVCYGNQFVVEVIGIGGAGDYSYSWILPSDSLAVEDFSQISDNQFSMKMRKSSLHFVRVKDFCGNIFEDSIRITVEPCIFIPNVISPNGDQLNDVFEISNITNYKHAQLRVYNRWGQKVFESENYLNDWSPSDLPSGTYYYVLNVEEFPEQRGDVTIIND